MASQTRKKADALAQMSGSIEAMNMTKDEVSVEYLARRFNATLEDCGVDSDVLPIKLKE